MKSAIRIGVVGAGAMGKQHAMLVAGSNIADMAGFADPDPSTGLDPVLAKVKYYRDHLKLIKAEAPDGIIIAVPNADHVSVAIDCLAAGIPILVEKPIADSVESGHALVAQQHKTGVAVWLATTVDSIPLSMPQGV